MDVGTNLHLLKSEPLARPGRPVVQTPRPVVPAEVSPKRTIDSLSEDLSISSERSVKTLEENRAALQEAIEELRKASEISGRELGFRVDNVTNRSIVTVSDVKSGEVIRQIPAEVVIRVARSIEQLKGLLFDKSL